MILIYTHENKIIVENARMYLAQHHVECEIKNEYSAGGMGELSPLETWPELWVEDALYGKATKLLENLLSKNEGDQWLCSSCGELNEASFEVCWCCQTDRTL